MRAFLVLAFVASSLAACKQHPDLAERVPIQRRRPMPQKAQITEAKTDVEASQKKEEKRDDKLVEQAK